MILFSNNRQVLRAHLLSGKKCLMVVFETFRKIRLLTRMFSLSLGIDICGVQDFRQFNFL